MVPTAMCLCSASKRHLHDSGTFFLVGSFGFEFGETTDGAADEWLDLSHRLDRCDHGGPLALGAALAAVRGMP
jgi:hypothetical protein